VQVKAEQLAMPRRDAFARFVGHVGASRLLMTPGFSLISVPGGRLR
jgi:hypothetical protein